jgi:hypothetical protein
MKRSSMHTRGGRNVEPVRKEEGGRENILDDVIL